MNRRFVLLCCVALLSALSPSHAAKHALLVGVSDLQHGPKSQWLAGPENDVPALRQLLIDKYGFLPQNIETLTKTGATRAGIERAFEKRLIAPVKPGDLVLFYFSGHGTQIDDTAPLDEADKLDEALVPYDAHSEETLIRDDDLGRWLARVPTTETVVLLDSCHSGTAARAGAKSRYITPQQLGITLKTPPATRGDGSLQSNDVMGSELTGPTVFSAAAAEEQALESPFLSEGNSTIENPYMGALTFYLLKALRQDAAFALHYEELFQAVRLALKQNTFQQTPQLEGFTKKRVFLSPNETPTPREHSGPSNVTSITQTRTGNSTMARVVSVDGQNVTLEAQGGALLTPGSIFETASGKNWRITTANEVTAPEKAPIAPVESAALRVVSSGGTKGQAHLFKGTLQTGARVVETHHAFADSKLSVLFLTTDAALVPLRDDLQNLFKTLDFLQIVTENQARDVEIEIARVADGSLQMKTFRNQQALPTFNTPDLQTAVPRLTEILQTLYLSKQMMALENPDAAFVVDIQVNGQDNAEITIGDTIEFTVRAERDAYAYLLDVDPAGKITVLFPSKFAPDNTLKAGQTYNMPAPGKRYKMRVKGPAGLETVKLIATEKPLQLDALANDGTFQPLTKDAASFMRDLLHQLKQGINKSGTRGIVLEADDSALTNEGWATDSVLLSVKERP